jgi:hypothetical protein
MPDEPHITINGVELTGGQAMTVRVAISTMFAEMSEPEALGNDDMGISIASGYKDRCAEILRIMDLRKG